MDHSIISVFFAVFQVDHSIIMYLIGPDGQYRAYYGRTRTEDDIEKDITKFMLGQKK